MTRGGSSTTDTPGTRSVAPMSTSFALTADANLPAVGFGTYLVDDADAADVVAEAIRVGYRHIDTAEGYHNEAGVGAGIAAAIAEGIVTRDELFITAKVFPGNEAWGSPIKDRAATIASLDGSLERLGLDRVDLYLIHAPFAGPRRIEQWQALTELQQQGKATAIGVSNFSEAHIEELRDAGLPLPNANQIELHPWSQKDELVAYLRANEIQPIAYSSLIPLSSWRASAGESAKSDEMRADGERTDSPFKAMAARYGVTEAQVLLRWAVQLGYAVLPKSTNRARMAQNLDLFSFEISDEDMAAIATMDRGAGVAWRTGDPMHQG